ncbi:protein YcaC [Escherichia coli]|uniref:Protein YcaC n=1 Tax=Escherichia coli TaxID=562 RepID=A0A376RKZ3_ECOLX|nr:protein YcaC [Escherichia coli]
MKLPGIRHGIACRKQVRQLMTWFGVACELHRDWRNDIEGLATLFSNHIPDYRNLMTSYDTLTKQK